MNLKLLSEFKKFGLSESDKISRDSFVFMRSTYDMLKRLSDRPELFIPLTLAICHYGLDMVEPNFNGDATLQALFEAPQAIMDSNMAEYLKRLERRTHPTNK